MVNNNLKKKKKIIYTKIYICIYKNKNKQFKNENINLID